MTHSSPPAATTPSATARSARPGGGVVRRAFWALSIAALIFFASSRPFVASPGFTRVDDKFGHFAVYGLLGTLVCRLGQGWRSAFWALVAVSAYGASDEWHQSLVPGRATEVADWVADTLGAAVAVTLYAGWTWYRELLERPLFRRSRQAGRAEVP